MKAIKLLLIGMVGVLTIVGTGCKSQYGKKVKEPFTGSKYESNKRYFRGTGKGVSQKDNIASGKADIQAKQELAAQVNTNISAMVDQYLGQTENVNAADVADKFQSLAREAMSTQLSDIRKIGEEKYFDGENYTVFIAYEIHKKQMFRFLKKQARVSKYVDKRTADLIEEMIDKELEQLED